jgi:hypothetical protein
VPLLLRPLLAVTFVLAVAACGSDEDAADEPSSTETSEAAGGDYCDTVAAYIDATSAVDTSTVEAIMSSFDAAAEAARATADAAPDDVAEAHDRLASAAEELVAGLDARDLQTMSDLEAANDELVTELTEKYGDLDQDVQQVEAFATVECDLSVE